MLFFAQFFVGNKPWAPRLGSTMQESQGRVSIIYQLSFPSSPLWNFSLSPVDQLEQDYVLLIQSCAIEQFWFGLVIPVNALKCTEQNSSNTH